MSLQKRYLLTIALMAIAMPCIAQTGQVTFYSINVSNKQAMKDALVPTGAISFTGWLFDGDRRLAHAQGGRFVSFHLAAGEHQFTVPYHSNHPGKTGLHLKVEPGGQYCVRLFAKYLSFILVPVGYVDSQIEQVPCQEAEKEAERYKPIDMQRVDSSVRTELDDSPGFPNGNQETGKR